MADEGAYVRALGLPTIAIDVGGDTSFTYHPAVKDMRGWISRLRIEHLIALGIHRFSSEYGAEPWGSLTTEERRQRREANRG